ncbi:MAG: glycoside hydrolase family 95 protein [Rikenellaceae bacterium]|nr:glycoside hydrolase family 95 protein [Rikenellaceae bacterium]
MKTTAIFPLFLFCILSGSNAGAQELKLWYDQPAGRWIEALPLGNGHIGAMVFGGVERELIQLNEGTLWSGGPRDSDPNPEAFRYLEPLREAIAREDYPAANLLARKMQGQYTESFMPMGDLHKWQKLPDEEYTGYYRDLSLRDAVALTRFTAGGVTFTREVFVSNPDRIMAVRITADTPRTVEVDITLSSLLNHEVLPVGHDRIEMRGKAPARVDPVYYNPGGGREPIRQEDSCGCSGMRFITIAQAVADGGEISADGTGIHISGADGALIILSAATSFNGFDKCPDSEGKDEKVIAERHLSGALQKDYADLRQRHTKDFRSFFDRLTFTLGNISPQSGANNLPSDRRLESYSRGAHDPDLEALYFQYGRYLLISASRPGGSAANLQGIWNSELRPPWSSNYTLNINTQMNYWPAESANLSEMHRPLLDLIADLSKTGAATAARCYGARGWVAHHNTDIWPLSNAVGMGTGDPVWANWYMGGAWLCRHLWEHYAFTGDTDYLRNRAYPVMKGAALFCLDWLTEKDGVLVTSPSTSPENAFMYRGNPYSLTEGATMDIAIIRELFTNLIEASEILGIDDEFRCELADKKSRLLPYRIGSQGQLLEWPREYEEADPHHRHLSHLVGLHPGSDISPLRTPALAQAARRSLEIRGDQGTGWSKAWKINLAARLLDGDHAYKLLRDIMTYTDGTGESSLGGGTYPNFLDAHPPFQIDGNFGATAGVIEMLVQSHLGEIHLLPALPPQWPSGEIEGVIVRGNMDLSVSWEEGRLTEAVMVSFEGGPCRIRTSHPAMILYAPYESYPDGDWYITEFTPVPGAQYTLTTREYLNCRPI